ncbi:hypothetical protein NQZ68_039861 [Dissostichus eleginoides]|nr:hypothetical protein NQZ68_039861 [Dissostichus eleginoides]
MSEYNKASHRSVKSSQRGEEEAVIYGMSLLVMSHVLFTGDGTGEPDKDSEDLDPGRNVSVILKASGRRGGFLHNDKHLLRALSDWLPGGNLPAHLRGLCDVMARAAEGYKSRRDAAQRETLRMTEVQ